MVQLADIGVDDLLLRPIRADDKPRLAEGLALLSDHSVYQRFLAPKPRFTAAELRYLTEVDQVHHVALVAVPREAPETLVAVGRWVRDRLRPDAAEVAVVVADALQGRGVGTMLGHALADAASVRGIDRFTATILPGNHAAHRLLEGVNERLAARSVDLVAA